MMDWTLFQQIGVPLAGVLAVLSAVRLARSRGGLLSGLFWLSLWTAAAVAIAFPDTTTQIARTLGIARGADLLLYCAVLAGFIGFWMLTVQQRRAQRDLTMMARAVALHHARRGGDAASTAVCAAVAPAAVAPAAVAPAAAVGEPS